MGQGFSQPKLSSEVTRNRIREVCLRDDSIPDTLKKFKIKLLVNDLNTIGFDIATSGTNGKALSNEQLCQEVRKRAIPSVESVCMLNGSSTKDVNFAAEQMAKHFNKFYGARISIYKNPLDPSQGKRSVADLCDDLYLVSDKMNRKLNDRPRVIKKKLEQEINVLKNYKKVLDNKFSNSLVSLQRSVNQDKIQDDIELSTKLYKIVSAELANQLYLAKEGAASIGEFVSKETSDQLKELGDGNWFGNQGSQLGLDMQNLGNILSEYRQYRFSDDDNSRSKKIQLLLQVLKTLPTAVDSCESCINKFGMSVDQYMKSDLEQLSPRLREKFLELMKKAGTDKSEIAEIGKCYNKLLWERNQCIRGGPLSSGVSNLSNGRALGAVADLRGAAQIIVENYARKVEPVLSSRVQIKRQQESSGSF